MNNSAIVFLINDTARAVKLEYEPDGPTSWAKTLDQDLQVGDMVVVESDTRHKMTTAKVKEIDVEIDYDTSVHLNWIVSKIDQGDYEKTLKLEVDAISAVRTAEREKKRKELQEAIFASSDQIKSLQLTDQSEVIE